MFRLFDRTKTRGTQIFVRKSSSDDHRANRPGGTGHKPMGLLHQPRWYSVSDAPADAVNIIGSRYIEFALST